MYGRQETYYLTITSPHKGERVIASVRTDDRFLAEKLLGCSILNKKGFGFKGLYTEEEVRHMFCPGTDVPGSMDIVTGQFLKHKDYTKAPALFMESGRIYRIRNNQRLFLDLSGKKNDFDYVLSVISGKAAPVASQPVQPRQNSTARPAMAAPAPPPVPTLDSYRAFAQQAEDEPDIAGFLEDTGDVEFYDDWEQDTKLVSRDVYSVLEQERAASVQSGPDYVSETGSIFYEAQKTVVLSEEDFQTQGELQAKLQERFGTSAGQPIRRQGQSLKDLFSGSSVRFRV